jgi:hypothetical protein
MAVTAFARARRIVIATFAGVLGLVGCVSTRAALPPPPEPVFYILAVPATVDSTISLARAALREINGTPQQPTFENNVTNVTTHYTRGRQDGGETRVAIVLEVSHKITDPSLVVSGVRLSGWALETPSEFLNRTPGGPAPPPTAVPRRFPGAAAITRESEPARQNHPRAITEADRADLDEMTHVLEVLLKHGARRMPQ